MPRLNDDALRDIIIRALWQFGENPVNPDAARNIAFAATCERMGWDCDAREADAR